ncbi:MAG: VOC family protein [Halobacteriaceae archaeon]
MPEDVPGIHHVTAVGSDPAENRTFYTETLGLRLVKRSVNQDDVSVYHLFYGDREGSPGTSMTVFPYPDAAPGRPGRGQATAVAFLVPADAVGYWADRLEARGHAVERTERFGDPVLSFADPDGLPLELVGREDAPAGLPAEGPVPPDRTVRGFFGVTLSLASADGTAALLRAMGYQRTDADRDRRRFTTHGDLGYAVDLCEDPNARRGRPGAGTVHHVAFRTTQAEHASWRDVLYEQGLHPSEVIDRTWFESIYVREPGGVLFEFATDGPGYTVDEEREHLGERLVLPEWLEDRRAAIEAGLPALE